MKTPVRWNTVGMLICGSCIDKHSDTVVVLSNHQNVLTNAILYQCCDGSALAEILACTRRCVYSSVLDFSSVLLQVQQGGSNFFILTALLLYAHSTYSSGYINSSGWTKLGFCGMKGS